jgi:hypothetical protein
VFIRCRGDAFTEPLSSNVKETHRQQGDLLSPHYFFQNKKNRLKKSKINCLCASEPVHERVWKFRGKTPHSLACGIIIDGNDRLHSNPSHLVTSTLETDNLRFILGRKQVDPQPYIALCTVGRCRSSFRGVLSNGQRTCSFRANSESDEARWINP